VRSMSMAITRERGWVVCWDSFAKDMAFPPQPQNASRRIMPSVLELLLLLLLGLVGCCCC